MRFALVNPRASHDNCTHSATPPPAAHSRRYDNVGTPSTPTPPSLSRRQQLALLSTLPHLTSLTADASTITTSSSAITSPGLPPPPPPSTSSTSSSISTIQIDIPNYAAPGPLQPLRLPNLEHTCTVCSSTPAERSRLKIHAWVPKGGARIGLPSKFPLAIITPGFLLAADQYTSYAERLASWGYAVVTYDRAQAALDPATDIVCVEFLQDLINWCRTSVPLGPLCDSNCVYLIGHSRGGKISTLAAARDPRVKALFLIDPVDVTVYAPLSADFPSAVAALRGLGASGRSLPMAVVGSGRRAADCAPSTSNYRFFYEASESPAWETVISDAGHLQYLDARSGNAMDLVCAAGEVPDAAVAEITAAMMVTWGEVMVRRQHQLPQLPNDDGDDSSAPQQQQQPPIQMGLDRDGRVVAGVASFSAMQALYATESALRAAVVGKVKSADFATRVKNFEM